LSGETKAIDFVSRLCEAGTTGEARKAALNQALASLDSEYAARFSDLAIRKKELHETKYKYENLSDLAESLGHLQESIDDNRRQLKHSETSLTSTGNVLEYDAAKTRSHKLIQIITARIQYDRAKEALKDSDGEEPAKRLAYIVDLQNAHETLQTHLSTPASNSELEELKDGFLAWQGAALVFAIQQADYSKLHEIQKIYQSLARQDEFTGIFRRVCSTRLKDLDLSNIDSIQNLLSTLYREVEYILDHYLTVIRRFKDEKEASAILEKAVTEGLENLDLSAPLSSMVGEHEDPIALCASISTSFNDYNERILKDEGKAKFVELIGIIKDKALKSIEVPIRSSFTNIALNKLNGLELKGASHRQHVENLNTFLTETIQLLEDIIVQSTNLFGEQKAANAYKHAIERFLDNFSTKLKSWEYYKSSSGQMRSVDDIFMVCSSSGHIVHALQEMKRIAENDSYKLNLKPFTRFNTQCCDRILKRGAESVVERMKESVQSIKREETDDTHTRSLPLFSISPHEYMTNAAQDLLHLFHKFEQFFLDDNFINAFHVALKKKMEGDEILKSIIADISARVVAEFIETVGDVNTLRHSHAKQFLVDTTFLKDALFDLRYDNLEELTKQEEKLKKIVDDK
ncbi:hypothetical protein PENTCL1PPCAC_28385, partial [Pristionchus entomophagus]